jgi:tRNA(Ile)-lysidine synthase
MPHDKRQLFRRFPWLVRVEQETEVYPRDRTYLVGVSGGLDSRVLLETLLLIGFERLVVCHLNHNLRGAESAEDARFVKELARRLHLDCYSDQLSELPGKGSLERSAREARLQFFQKATQKFSASTVFLGHHADDQIETFLFNLFRGTGSIDNAAIKPESEVCEQQITLLRPLLHVWKKDLLEFASARQLQFREDSTNQSLQMTRNRIRHDLIPMIESTLGRPIKQSLLRAIDLAVIEGEFMRSQLPVFANEKQLPVKELRLIPIALQRLTILHWLRRNQVKDCGFDEVESVRRSLTSTKVAKVNLPGGIFCRRRAGVLFVQR